MPGARSTITVRWYAFGLNPPGAPAMPDIPEGLVLAGSGAGAVAADWGGAGESQASVTKQIVVP